MKDLFVVFLYHKTGPGSDTAYNLLHHHLRIFQKLNPSVDYTVLCDEGKFQNDDFVYYDEQYSQREVVRGKAWKSCDTIFFKYIASSQCVPAKNYLYIEYDCLVNTDILSLLEKYKHHDVCYSFEYKFGNEEDFIWFKEHKDIIERYNIPRDHLRCLSPFNFTLWKRDFLLRSIDDYIANKSLYQTLVSDVRLGLLCSRLQANSTRYDIHGDRIYNFAMRSQESIARKEFNINKTGVYHPIKDIITEY